MEVNGSQFINVNILWFYTATENICLLTQFYSENVWTFSALYPIFKCNCHYTAVPKNSNKYKNGNICICIIYHTSFKINKVSAFIK